MTVKRASTLRRGGQSGRAAGLWKAQWPISVGIGGGQLVHNPGRREDSLTVEPAFGRVCIVLGESNSFVRSHVALPVPPVTRVRFEIHRFGSAHRRDLIGGHRIIIVVDGSGVEHCEGEGLCRVDHGSPETLTPSEPLCNRKASNKRVLEPRYVAATYFIILARYLPESTRSCSSGVNNVFILGHASKMVVSWGKH